MPDQTKPRKKRTKSITPVDENYAGQITGTSTEVDDDAPRTEDESKTLAAEAFLTDARDLFHAIADDPNETRIRESALEDLKFYNNDQWPDDTKQRLQARKRPVLTINRIKPACRQVINSLLQDRPSIKINPVDDKADVKTAQTLQGLVRHIEVQSMADIAYDTALNGQVIHGFGYLRVITKYPTPFSLHQEAYIVKVDDPFCAYLGPHKEPEDLNDAFFIYDYTPEQYTAEFGGKDKDGNPISAFAGLNDFTSVGNRAKGWGDKATIRVCEYYKRTFDKKTIIWNISGQPLIKDNIANSILLDMETNGELIMDETVKPGEPPRMLEREVEIPKVTWYKFNALEILDETVHPGAYIPVIRVEGDKQIVDGQIHLSGIVRDSKDAQKQYNYFRSKMTETVALAPTAPWIMAEGQDENHETEWDTANIENYSVLRYKPKSIGGHLAPPPSRNFGEPPIQAMVVAASQYEDDIKATTQVYDPSLGAKSNEVSGIAQRTRIQQSATANFTYANNFSRSLRYLGVVLIDLICGDGVTRKGIYDERTIARIIGEDNTAHKVQVINDRNKPAYAEEPIKDDETGELTGDIRRIYNLGVGQYDVAIGIGPSYLTKQQEAFDMLTKIVNSYPEMMKFAGDVIMRASGLPDAGVLADRIKRFIEITMPGVIESDEDQPIPPKAQQALKELMQQVEVMGQQLQEAKQIIETKQIENAAKMQTEKIKQEGQGRIEEMKLATQEFIESMKSEAQVAVAMLKEQSNELNSRLGILDTLIANLTKPGPVSATAGA